jgi:hypothetical protein
MTILETAPLGRARRVGRVLHQTWPIPVVVAAALIAQGVLLTSRYDVGGHAAEHLSGASVPFLAAAVVFSIFWATPRARRQPDVIVAACTWFATTLLVMVGNLRVVDDLVAGGYARTPTDSVPDIADHSLANSSIWYAVVAALLLIAVCSWRRHLGTRSTIGAVVATVIIPPWIIPGAGVVVLAIVRVVVHVRGQLGES